MSKGKVITKVTKKVSKYIYDLFRLSILRFIGHGYSYRAAALAYTTLLALVPLLTVTFAIMTIFPAFSQFAEEIKQFLFTHLVATSAETIEQYLQNFISRAGSMSAMQTSFLLLVVIILVYTIECAFNDIWHVKKSRSWSNSFLLYWTIITLTPILAVSTLAISSYIFSLPFISESAQAAELQHWVLRLAPDILSFVTFTLIYFIVPNFTVRLRYAILGGLIATILFDVAKTGFAFYITHYAKYSVVYGTLSTALVFLIWIYLSWIVTLFGAIVSRIAYELDEKESK